MIITIDDYISWRKSTRCINLKYIAGDTAVLSISKNGVDAQAMYINSILTEYSIEPGCWFTVETLGYKTEIEENINSGSGNAGFLQQIMRTWSGNTPFYNKL